MKEFFVSWALWEEMTFVLAAAIVLVFIVALLKLWWSSRIIKRIELQDTEKRARLEEMRKAGAPMSKKRHGDIPFGVRAIQSGVEVEGIWISHPTTPTRTPSKSKMDRAAEKAAALESGDDTAKEVVDTADEIQEAKRKSKSRHHHRSHSQSHNHSHSHSHSQSRHHHRASEERERGSGERYSGSTMDDPPRAGGGVPHRRVASHDYATDVSTDTADFTDALPHIAEDDAYRRRAAGPLNEEALRRLEGDYSTAGVSATIQGTYMPTTRASDPTAQRPRRNSTRHYSQPQQQQQQQQYQQYHQQQQQYQQYRSSGSTTNGYYRPRQHNSYPYDSISSSSSMHSASSSQGEARYEPNHHPYRYTAPAPPRRENTNGTTTTTSSGGLRPKPVPVRFPIAVQQTERYSDEPRYSDDNNTTIPAATYTPYYPGAATAAIPANARVQDVTDVAVELPSPIFGQSAATTAEEARPPRHSRRSSRPPRAQSGRGSASQGMSRNSSNNSADDEAEPDTDHRDSAVQPVRNKIRKSTQYRA